MHLELDPHPHPHPAVGSRRGLLPWLLIGAVVATSAYLALRGGPDDTVLAARFREAVSILEQYDYLPAYNKFAEIAAARPTWAAAHFNAGLAALNFRQDEKTKKDYLPIAEAEFRRALEIDPNNLNARFCLGILLKYRDRLDEAFDAFQAVAKADPRDPYALYEYGAMLSERKKFEEAKEVLEAAVKLQPAFASALYKLGQDVYRNLKENEKRVEALKVFQTLRESQEQVLRGDKYGEDGKYASAIRDPLPPTLASRPAVPAAGTIPAGDWKPLGAAAAARTRPDGSPAPPGFCLGDLDGDAVPDLVLPGQPASGNTGTEIWKGEGSGMAFRKPAGKIDADGVSVALGDLNGDGSLDLVFAGEGSLKIYSNDGKGSFAMPDKPVPLPAGKGFPLKVLVFDADSDWDLDILVVRQLPKEEKFETAIELLNSNRDGTFEDIAGKIGIARLPLVAEGALFADLDGDIDLDILILAKAREESLVLVNDRAWRYRQVPAKEMGGIEALLARAGCAPRMGNVPAASPAETSESMLETADSTGRPFIFRARSGSPLEIAPAGPAPRTWIGIDLAGKKDPKPGQEWANLSGVGATVEVAAGNRSSIRQVNCCGTGGAWGPTVLAFDLDGQDQIDFVRILWPDGVLQSERGLAAGKIHRIEEVQRKPSSCPILFAWDGTRFQYVGDFLGVGGLGYLEAPGTYSKPDATEVIELPALAAVGGPDGRDELRLSVIEPLEECTYLDSLALVAVDAPAGLTVHPDEIFPVRAPAPGAALYVYEKPLFPARASDAGGRDVTEALRSVDRIYAGAKKLDRRFPGAAEPHAVILDWAADLPRAAGDPGTDAPRPVLFLHGFVEYGYSTSNFAAAQARVALHAPTISVERGGGWAPLRVEWGFPAGTPRWMTVDLGDSLEAGDRRLRIDSDMEIYWDQAFLARAEPISLGDQAAPPRTFTARVQAGAGDGGQSEILVRAMAPDRAELRFRGFPRDRSPDGRMPKLYDYDDVSPTDQIKPFPGRFTRYGEVADLIGRADDRLAILGPGDEVLLGFRADRLGAPAPGMKRTFFLTAVGYCKDMDLYTAASDRVEPLPFRAMTSYPPLPGESALGGLDRAPRNDRIVEQLILTPES